MGFRLARWGMYFFFGSVLFVSCVNGAVDGSSESELPAKPPEPTSAESSPIKSSVSSPAASLPVVVRVTDGDTIEVNDNGMTKTIRLACIDAPEGDQPGGEGARVRLSEYLPNGQTVKIRPVDTDQYDRTVAELYLADHSLNLQLVKEGWALAYPDYLDNCAPNQDSYRQAQSTAQASALGVWSLPSEQQIAPWDWRAGVRPAPVAVVEPQPAIVESAAIEANAPKRGSRCSDFASQAEAQAAFEYYGLSKLDRDKDGVACEAL